MAIDFLKYLYSNYQKHKLLENTQYILNKNTQYVLFSGTSLGDDGDIRHLNDLYFIIFILDKYDIPKENITLAVDEKILENLKSPGFMEFYLRINATVGKIINPENFISEYKRDKNKDFVFIASGHGHINGLHLTATDSFVTSDYFEDIASKTSNTLLIMSQCYAGAFHHLDTRKNICVLGSSDYQESLSIDLFSLVTFKKDGKSYYKPHINPDLWNFISDKLSFNHQLYPINPFLFSLFLVLFEPDKHILSRKKHLINIYKCVVALTSDNLSNTYQHVKIGTHGGNHIIEGIRISQQSYLLNKILASRYNIN